ncbi:DUF4082 domain-containing protein [Frigoriflavimonas asaccharolytica]|uniref:DUF4082 domain-containing protein n=1 Tax=Frigoriflavimonas asaccharolytica TaxID=2735899 RepID=A0A8J8G8S4_9FLAO|nr:DUF4082 domain-containing protein [Frigoriflavimonas asaccharolytica]NRS91574.1 hypothetical protein [Frigoriflavimonas asaccharolytica]
MKTNTFSTSKNLFSKMLLIFVFMFALESCRKDNDELIIPTVVYAVESPMSAYMASLSDTTPNTVNGANYEVGVVISPKVQGNLNALQIKLPIINNAVRVTIWDTSTQAIIRTEVVDVNANNTVITKNIAALALQKDKQYTVTMNVAGYYYYGSSAGPALTSYPLTIGNIIYNNFIYGTGVAAAAAYPTITSAGEYAGELNVVFQQTP